MNGKEFFEGLTDDQRRAFSGCKTLEDAMAVCRNNGVAIPDELLEEINGGSSSETQPRSGLICPSCNHATVSATDCYFFTSYECSHCNNSWIEWAF